MYFLKKQITLLEKITVELKTLITERIITPKIQDVDNNTYPQQSTQEPKCPDQENHLDQS
jgi:hypothetical protein